MSVPRALKSPTLMGQTSVLTRLDGATVAACCWPRLPYWMRELWGPRIDEGFDAKRVERYLLFMASPVARALAAQSERLPEDLRRRAAELAADEHDGAPVDALERHFAKLMSWSRKRLLAHLSVAERADATLDRLDLLAEVTALRLVQADVSSERSLARAFRAMFATRNPWAVYLVAGVCLVAYLLLLVPDPREARGIVRTLALYPDIGSPWALLTYPWLHLGAVHMTLNVASLLLVGHVLEQILGSRRFLLTYVACAVGAGLASVVYKQLFDVPFWTVGASGAIAGMAGMALYLGWWFQARYGRLPIRYAFGTLAGGLVLASNIVVSAAGGGLGADHGAHLGGLALGVGIGFALRRRLGRQADARFGPRPVAPPGML